ncbi:MAG: GlsB/YeaQ/YmgE family stress response membrane protein [Gammaproteobacteria bacterium]|nr:GlsB/YeaQ/YmgE family stress response membrane protein [Gammaproteobacteria bacterium]
MRVGLKSVLFRLVLGATLLGEEGVRLMGPFGQLVTALIGAVLLLWLARLFGRK